jgi:hypothetical protein
MKEIIKKLQEQGTKGMNVDKFGPTCMWLYDYDMFNKEIRYKVKYKDITFIEE